MQSRHSTPPHSLRLRCARSWLAARSRSSLARFLVTYSSKDSQSRLSAGMRQTTTSRSRRLLPQTPDIATSRLNTLVGNVPSEPHITFQHRETIYQQFTNPESPGQRWTLEAIPHAAINAQRSGKYRTRWPSARISPFPEHSHHFHRIKPSSWSEGFLLEQ
jgi:hypothetical protein